VDNVDRVVDGNSDGQLVLSLTDRLFSMAGYRNLSATSYGIFANIEHTAFGVGNSARKMYLAVHIANNRLVGLLDSGSDLTILQLSVLESLKLNKPKPSDIPSLTTFSNNKITILGELNVIMKVDQDKPGIHVKVHVIKDIINIPKLLLGSNFLQASKAKLGFHGKESLPTLEINNPVSIKPTIYFEDSVEIHTCLGYCDLDPYEKDSITFFLHCAAPVIRTDHVLISSIQISDISVIPSRTDLTWDSTYKCFAGTACVVNITDKVIQNGFIKAKFEIVNSFDAKPLEGEIAENLQRLVSRHPLGREILECGSTLNSQLPLMTVHSISTNPKSVEISDDTLAEALFATEPEFCGVADLDHRIIEPKGIDVPTIVYKNAEEAVQLDKFPPHVQPFVHEIFVVKYPQVVSLHSLDAGNVSLTLGYTQLRLRKGEVLPRSRRIFHVSPGDERHLTDITDLLVKFGYICRSPTSPTGHHLYGMSSYLIPRAKPGCLGRLIIDYSPVNSLIESPASVIPEINKTLQCLKSKTMFSSLDLRQAYLSLRIDEESRPLTTFLTPTGSFQWLALPTGAANSPAHFSVAMDKILQNKIVLDKNGLPIYDRPNEVRLEKDPLPDTISYFDDIVIASELRPTYAETLKLHFESLEKAIARLAFHGTRISVGKCTFARSSILFLGWYVSRDFVIADPRRIKKVREYAFPTNKKGMRAFLGLINSLRKVAPLDVIKQVSVLTPLTSSKTTFEPTEKQIAAFHTLKQILISEPLFCNLIDEKANKYLFVDAATSSGVLGAVLAQKIKNTGNDIICPEYLNLDDPVHQILYDLKLPYRPCSLYTSLPIILPKQTAVKTIPPKIAPLEPLLGFTTENVQDSLFYSVLSILAVYNCKLPNTILELRKQAIKKLKQTILYRQLLDFQFNLDYNKMNEFVNDFTNGLIGPDDGMYIVHALAQTLYRPIIVISTLEKHKTNPVITFHESANRPPIVLGLYCQNGIKIFTPFFYSKNTEFKLESLKNKIQIIGYSAKCIPPGFESRSILDLEVFAILESLYSFQKLISNVPVTLLTDSRVLYYLFSSKVGDSSVKIRRWCLKLISDYPMVSLHFIKTSENLADFLTREGLPQGDLQKFCIKDLKVADIFEKLPKVDFTLLQWAEFVEAHPEYLTVNNKQPEVSESHVLAIQAGIENVRSVSDPVQILRDKLTREKIIIAQKTELSEIYTKCLASADFSWQETLPNNQNGKLYKLVFNLLMVHQGHFRIYLPPSMVGLLLSLTHLLGHLGHKRMLANLNPYYFPKMSSITKTFVSRCHPCFLSHRSNRKQTLGFYPLPVRPCQEFMADLAENIGASGGYQNLLIMQCVLTDYTVIIPLKSKTAIEITRAMLGSVLQIFNVEKLHTDNGPAFRSAAWLESMSAFGIKIISSAALHPEGRGQIERHVQTIKLLLRKFLATRPTLDWAYLPYLIAKILNNTVSPKTNFKPQEMVFGTGAGDLFLANNIATPHISVRNNLTHITEISNEIKEMTKIASTLLTELRVTTNEKLNKSRSNKEFKINDIVFVLDRSIVPGNAQVLRTKFSPSPYVVVKPNFTTTVVKRLADGFTSVYGNADLKLFKKFDPEFNTLPKEVLQVLMHDYENFLTEDFATLASADKLDLPTSIELFIPDENYMDADDDEDDPLIDGNISNPVPGPSNFDQNIQNLHAPNFVDPLDAILADDGTSDADENQKRKIVVNNVKSQSESDNNNSDSDDQDYPEPRRRLRRNRLIHFAQVH